MINILNKKLNPLILIPLFFAFIYSLRNSFTLELAKGTINLEPNEFMDAN